MYECTKLIKVTKQIEKKTVSSFTRHSLGKLKLDGEISQKCPTMLTQLIIQISYT